MVVFSTKSSVIHDELRQAILSGALKPGTDLIIKQIAEQYGISDIPVREALKKLNAEGLVDSIPHVGSKVASISLQNIEDMLIVREHLDSLAAKLAAENADDRIIASLEAYCSNMQTALTANDVTAYQALNKKFHSCIIEASGNQVLIKMINDLLYSEKRMAIIFRSVFELFPDIIRESMADHQQMMIYFRSKNSKALAKLMYRHKKRAFDKMRRYIRENIDKKEEICNQ